MALGKIGAEARAAVPVLTAILKDRDEDRGIRHASALVLTKVGSTAISSLTELLKDQDTHTQWFAAWALGEIGPEAHTAIPALVDLLKQNNEPVRQCVARALGKTGPEAVPALIELLKDRDVLVRWAAVNGLAEIRPATTNAATALTQLLKDKNQEIRDVAASALGRSDLQMLATKAEARRIKELIADLAKIDSPYFGYSPTMGGIAFAPIASSGEFEGGLLFTNHGLKRNAAFTSLVELGPKALPFLLESLDDPTPTRLTGKHDQGFGAMWFGHEIGGNLFNMHETAVLTSEKVERDFWNRRYVQQYTLRVGDVCFVAVGQITNRSYNAVRYQPSLCVVINSTVQDRRLAAEVRAIWGNSHYRQKLLDSLLIDFNTRGLSSRGFGSQVGAAMRLAYYFPEASEELIVARLKELERVTEGISKEALDVQPEEFEKAVSCSSSPKVRAELLDISRKATKRKGKGH